MAKSPHTSPSELRVGDQLELRGPIGGYFVWTPDDDRPLLLAGGGSGIVPLMAMLRARIAAGSSAPVRLLVSARSIDEIIYRTELESIESANSGRRDQPDADPNAALGLDGLRTARGSGDVGRDRLADRPTASVICVRTDRLRRNGHVGPRRARARTREHPDRAIRSDWRMRWRAMRTSTAMSWAAC